MAKRPHVGISGWNYAPWRKTFYPEGLTQKRELEFASRQVNSIEVNGAFYSLPRPASFLAWYRATPEDFVFSIKAHRFTTHVKKLNHVEEPLANFFASGVLALKEKLGPILWQFPPAMTFKIDRWRTFLDLLPGDFKAATRLARGHGPIMEGRTFTPPRGTKNFAIRHAVEVRHESFNDPEFMRLLKEHNVALVTADTAGKWPYFELPTADFVYVRMHGDVKLYESGYTDEALMRWSRKIKSWTRTRDAYVYFDNDIKVQAPYNAVDLLRLLIEDYEPGVPMDKSLVANLKTPGPRLTDDDPRWRRKKASGRRG